ncbi:MAG: hypothetical protein V4555_07500 [Acidobacteriota bacterium]
MLEPHPPEHTPHSWRDFFIHIATITVGLLIAVGIEQTVELIHHRHQRHELEENMRAEAERNVDILTTHLDVNIPNLLWSRAALIAIRSAPEHNGFIDLTLPPPDPNRSHKIMTAPERNVWPAAKAAGTVVLLPAGLAQAYAQVDMQADFDDREVERIRDASALTTRFELATGSRIAPGKPLHLTPAQRDQLVLALSTEIQSLYDLLRRDNLFLVTSQGLLSGVQDTPSLVHYVAAHAPLRTDQYR